MIVLAGIAGDSGVRGTGQQPRIFVAMILILIFSEVRARKDSYFGFREIA